MDVYGIIGWPVAHSLSPAMHNAAFKALGQEAVYGKFPVAPERLSAAVEGLRALGIKGVSVTIPHKEAVRSLLQGIHQEAQKIGAVNTILNDNGRLVGFNTDWQGALRALEEQISLKGKEAVVLGAGGAARAVVYALKKAGALVCIYNRTFTKAQELALTFGAKAFAWEALSKARGHILINTTSVGLKEDRSPAPAQILSRFQVVMDIVYTPLETRLLREAKAQGCKTISGLKMLVYQAVEQFYLWRGLRPEARLLEEAALAALTKEERHGEQRN